MVSSCIGFDDEVAPGPFLDRRQKLSWDGLTGIWSITRPAKPGESRLTRTNCRVESFSENVDHRTHNKDNADVLG